MTYNEDRIFFPFQILKEAGYLRKGKLGGILFPVYWGISFHFISCVGRAYIHRYQCLVKVKEVVSGEGVHSVFDLCCVTSFGS